MFPNLEAEQHRFGMTNADVAKSLKMSRSTYEAKKRSGNFSWSQLVALCDLFGCKFEYLFKVGEPKRPADRIA